MEGSGSSSSGSNVPTTKLKVSGLWSGVIEVGLEWSVGMLRAELAKTSLCSPQNLKVISGGKILKEELADKKLREVGLRANSRILISKVDANEAKAVKDEVDAQNRLARIKAAVDAMAKRHTDNSSFPEDDFLIELETSGEKLKIGSETDQRALLSGLMLHSNGRRLIKMGKYRDALDVLGMGEEALSICDPKVMERVVNAVLLQIDTVWCYFMLRDISCLTMAGMRLKEARKRLQLWYGANMERARVLQGGLGFCRETATYMRLELLEGVVAYHMGLLEESYKALTSAQAKYRQFQVSDESLATLVNMGFTTKQSKRALIMCSQDVGRAIEFAIEERERIAKKKEENKQHYREVREQKSYGRTPLGKAVDMTKLTGLASIGYERTLAAEALRRNENDFEKTLDELTNPASNSALQASLESRLRRRNRRKEEIAEMISRALLHGGTREEAIGRLLQQLQDAGAAGSSALLHGGTSEEAVGRLLHQLQNAVVGSSALLHGGTREEAIGRLLQQLQNVGAGSSASSQGRAEVGSAASEEERQPQSATLEGQGKGRDKEMEEDIVNNVRGDLVADYDIEVEEEGQAIAEYLSLLLSARQSVSQ